MLELVLSGAPGIRRVSRAWEAAAEGAGLERLAGRMSRDLGRRVPRQTAVWMARWLGAARVPGWVAALRFWNAVRLATDTGAVVAGSAALFVERALEGDPGFRPNDVDAWVDDMWTGERLLWRAADAFRLASPTTVDYCYRGTVVRDAPLTARVLSSGAPRLHDGVASDEPTPPHTAMATLSLGPDVSLQVIGQFVERPSDCKCELDEACLECMTGQTGEYKVAAWPAGRPETRFDNDACMVALASAAAAAYDDPIVKLRREMGSTWGPELRLAAQSLWALDRDNEPVPRDSEWLDGRLAKYRERGYTSVVVPRRCRVLGRELNTHKRPRE